MGAITFSIDTEFVKFLQTQLPLDILVETGTFEGETIKQVSDLFKALYTVELSPEYFSKAQKAFTGQSHIHLYNDASPSVIKQLVPNFAEKSVLYWLDAHWCVADYTSGDTSQCPLLEELKAIDTLNQGSVIMIDDARYFLCPPPYPHEISQWPDLNKIISRLIGLSSQHKFAIFNDVIVFYPISIDADIQQYMHKHAVDWLQISYKAEHYDDMQKAAEERLVLIQQLEQACKEKAEHYDDMQKAAEERLVLIQQLDQACKEKDAFIQDLNAQLLKKKH